MGNVAISADHAKLGALLRIELTAVHQQFFHALALRQWNETAIVDPPDGSRCRRFQERDANYRSARRRRLLNISGIAPVYTGLRCCGCLES